MASDFERIEAEIKAQRDAEYQRGWREGWAKGKAMVAIDKVDISNPYDAGRYDGHRAALEGKENLYPEPTD